MNIVYNEKAACISMGLGMLVWVADAAMDSFIFREGSFSSELLDFSPEQTFMRLTIMLAVVFAAYSRFVDHELRRTKRSALESEQHCRLLFESSKDAIYITRREGPFLQMNQATLDLFGYTREEMIGMDILENGVSTWLSTPLPLVCAEF